jgi:hypothetical protein
LDARRNNEIFQFSHIKVPIAFALLRVPCACERVRHPRAPALRRAASACARARADAPRRIGNANETEKRTAQSTARYLDALLARLFFGCQFARERLLRALTLRELIRRVVRDSFCLQMRLKSNHPFVTELPRVVSLHKNKRFRHSSSLVFKAYRDGGLLPAIAACSSSRLRASARAYPTSVATHEDDTKGVCCIRVLLLLLLFSLEESIWRIYFCGCFQSRFDTVGGEGARKRNVYTLQRNRSRRRAISLDSNRALTVFSSSCDCGGASYE